MADPDRKDAAGASARREYERRRDNRRDHARQKLGPLGSALARIIEEPTHTTSWKRGAEGEERVGARLAKLLKDSGVWLLHDRRRPGGGSANIDHIAVGPGGITVIDTKNCRGKVRKDRVGGLFVERHDILLIDGRDRTSLVKKVEKQVAAVERVVQRYADVSVPVVGALCFADVNGLPWRSLRINGVLVDGTRGAAGLARRAGDTSPEQVKALRDYLDEHLPPATD